MLIFPWLPLGTEHDIMKPPITTDLLWNLQFLILGAVHTVFWFYWSKPDVDAFFDKTRVREVGAAPKTFLKKCVRCGKEIPLASEECPYCEAKQS